MKMGKKGLRLSSGKTVHFRSSEARDLYESYARAYKHGFRPTKKRKKKAK